METVSRIATKIHYSGTSTTVVDITIVTTGTTHTVAATSSATHTTLVC